MTPEQIVAEALKREVWVGWPGCDDQDCGIVVGNDRQTLASHALDAVRAALTSDDPVVVRAMAERIGLTVSERERYEAVCRGSLNPDGQPRSFSFGADRAERVLERIRRSELGLSPETHICMRATQTSMSISTWSPWTEVPDADA